MWRRVVWIVQCFGLKFFRLFQWNESFKRNLREYNFGILWKVLLKQNGKFESVPSCCIPLETLENAEILTAKVFAENKSGEELIDAFSKTSHLNVVSVHLALLFLWVRKRKQVDQRFSMEIFAVVLVTGQFYKTGIQKR